MEAERGNERGNAGALHMPERALARQSCTWNMKSAGNRRRTHRVPVRSCGSRRLASHFTVPPAGSGR